MPNHANRVAFPILKAEVKFGWTYLVLSPVPHVPLALRQALGEREAILTRSAYKAKSSSIEMPKSEPRDIAISVCR